MIPEVHRPLALDRVAAAELTVLVQAEATELPSIAARLGIPAIHALRCEFRLKRVGGSMVEGHGELLASLTQTCVVSLEDFDSVVQDAFTIHFVPAGTEDDDPDPDAPDQIPYEGSVLDLGEAAVEQLALALDPYPRKAGASLASEASDMPTGAFAGLAALRTRQ